MSDDKQIKWVTKSEQIEQMIRERIRSGELKPTEKLEAETKIAKQLGVHRLTVNKAMANLVREGLLHRVQGRGTFVADPASRTRTGCLGVLYSMPSESLERDSFCGRILNGIHEATADDVLLIGKQKRERGYPGPDLDEIGWDRFDGLILIEVFDEEYIARLRAVAPVPMVVVDCKLEKVHADYVVLDDAGGAHQATKYLQGLGHTRIGHVGERMPHPDWVVDPAWQERRRGWEAAMKEAKLPYEDLFFPVVGRGSGGLDEIMAAILAMPEDQRPTALTCATDGIALDMMRMYQEKGVQVPGGVSIVGYGDYDAGPHAHPPLASVRINPTEMGRRAAERLQKLLGGADATPRQIVIPVELIERESCAAPKG